jgi:hypothetical protein
MKKGSAHHTAQGVIGLLVLAIGFVLFYKFATNQDAFMDDANALRNYVVLSILAMGFLLGLFFLATKQHKPKAVKAAPKSSKKKKSR